MLITRIAKNRIKHKYKFPTASFTERYFFLKET